MLVETVGGGPVLGYLLSWTFRGGDVPAEDWEAFLDRLEADPVKAPLVPALRSGKKDTTINDYQSSCREFDRAHDKGRKAVRYFLRVEEGKTKLGAAARHIVRETFAEGVGGKSKPIHTTLGRVWLAEGQPAFAPAPALLPAEEEEAQRLFAAFAEIFNAQRGLIPLNNIRGRVAGLVNDALPISYDSSHLWKFLFHEHRSRIVLAEEIVDWLNARTVTASRVERSEVASIPLPDLDEMRDAIAGAYAAEVEEAAAAAANAVTAYEAEHDEKALLAALRRCKEAQDVMVRYEREFRGVAALAAQRLSDLQEHARVLLGGGMSASGTRVTSWARARKGLAAPQAAFGDALIREDDAYPLIPAHGEVISWRYGVGEAAEALVMQTSLDDPDRVHVTLTVPTSRLSEALRAKARRAAGGWVLEGPAPEVLAEVLPWWKMQKPAAEAA
jgi:hypothetical protein